MQLILAKIVTQLFTLSHSQLSWNLQKTLSQCFFDYFPSPRVSILRSVSCRRSPSTRNVTRKGTLFDFELKRRIFRHTTRPCWETWSHGVIKDCRNFLKFKHLFLIRIFIYLSVFRFCPYLSSFAAKQETFRYAKYKKTRNLRQDAR